MPTSRGGGSVGTEGFVRPTRAWSWLRLVAAKVVTMAVVVVAVEVVVVVKVAAAGRRMHHGGKEKKKPSKRVLHRGKAGRSLAVLLHRPSTKYC